MVRRCGLKNQLTPTSPFADVPLSASRCTCKSRVRNDTSNTFEEYAREGIHIPEVSDPFSDGKIANFSRLDRLSSSRYSEDPLPVISESGRRSHTEDSSHQTSARSYGEYSQRYARRHEVPHSVSLQDRISSLSSQSNCITGMGLLDPVKARAAFNVVAGQFNLPLGILADEPETANGKHTLEIRDMVLMTLNLDSDHCMQSSKRNRPSRLEALRVGTDSSD